MKNRIEKIEAIKNEIAKGNLFVWNDDDSGLFAGINRNNGCPTIEQAEEEMADAFAPKMVDENHSWIYNLVEELGELESTFTYCDSLAGDQDIEFSSLEEAKKYIDEFPANGDSDGAILKGGIEVAQYRNRDGVNYWTYITA